MKKGLPILSSLLCEVTKGPRHVSNWSWFFKINLDISYIYLHLTTTTTTASYPILCLLLFELELSTILGSFDTPQLGGVV